MHRLLVIGAIVLAGLASSGTAGAWSWPADGAVLRPFALGQDVYAAGQHRGIDVAGVEGSAVRAPATGTVTFAGSVPTNGRGVTILTADGYAVTLFHLGTIGVGKGEAVLEGAPIGSLGWSGEPEHTVPTVHLGVRVAAQAEGYVDPAGLLPARPTPAAPPPPTPPPAAAPVPAPTPAPAPPAASAPPPAPAPVPAQPGPSPQPANGTVQPGNALPDGAPGASSTAARTGSPQATAGEALQTAPAGTGGRAGSAPDGAAGGLVIIAASPAPRAGRPDAARPTEQRNVGRAPGIGSSRVVSAAREQPAAWLEERPRGALRHGWPRRTAPAGALAIDPPQASRAPVRRSGAAKTATRPVGSLTVVRTAPAAGSDRGGGWNLPLLPAALALGTVLAGAATRRAARRIGGNGAVLHHHADLLRQLDAAHRPRLHDRRGRRLRTSSAAARP